MDPIRLEFMMEKREGYGEDSSPLSIVRNDLYAVGVFDGMGGSGAAICQSLYGETHTKAYVASRIIQKEITNYIKEKAVDEIDSEGIKNTAKKRLEKEKKDFQTKTSGLRSKLVRDYPTTLAIIMACNNENGSYTIKSYWAGDSRNYLWTQEGFYQISKDDLDAELDPLENLRNDGALSNCICADRDFHINAKEIENVTGKFIILSATDGCFNYFPTPMHFHEVLLTGLKKSTDEKTWEDFCKEKISAVTGDDVSLSLMAVGFEDFNELKNSFEHSEISCIKKIEDAQKKIEDLSKKLEDAKDSIEIIIQDEWSKYKMIYMKYIEDRHDILDQQKTSLCAVEQPKEKVIKNSKIESGQSAVNSESIRDDENPIEKRNVSVTTKKAEVEISPKSNLRAAEYPSINPYRIGFNAVSTFLTSRIEYAGFPKEMINEIKQILDEFKSRWIC